MEICSSDSGVPKTRDAPKETAREIVQEVKSLLDRAYAAAQEILGQHRDQLEGVSVELLKHETLDGPRFYELNGLPLPEAKAKSPPNPPLATRQTGELG